MSATLSATAFDALHPFSFETDEHDRITRVGRSLRKILPDINPGDCWRDLFIVKQPQLTTTPNASDLSKGEVVLLLANNNPRVRLRGQVVKLREQEPHFIFSLSPLIWEATQVIDLGLDISDFECGASLFDYLLYSRAHIRAREKAQEAQAKLEWDAKLARLLHEVALATYSAPDIETAYQIAIDSVCKSLNWEVGHVLVCSHTSIDTLTSSGIWRVTDQTAYADLQDLSKDLVFTKGIGLPGRVLAERQVLWMQDAASCEFFLRKTALAKLPQVSAIAAPVIVADQVQAVLEFYTRHNAVELGISLDFFKVFAIQLSRVYEKLESARKEREQLAMLAQASKMATLGELSAGVAHEINNPVSTISLISEIIKRLSRTGKLSPEELATQLARLDLCLKRISKIVSELQAFSRDATQDGFLQASIKTIVEETLGLCQARLMRSRIKLQVDEIDPTWSIECRESQISQVLLNLLSNAHDAVHGTEKAWIALSVKELGEHFEISVTDSGHGIPESIAQKVMKPFFTTKPLGKGTGLGLSISSNIMIDHHGELRVDTTSANTRFVMTLPKKRQEQIFHETA